MHDRDGEQAHEIALSDDIFLSGSAINSVSRIPVRGTGHFGITADCRRHLLLHRLACMALQRCRRTGEGGMDCTDSGSFDRVADLFSVVVLAPSEV